MAKLSVIIPVPNVAGRIDELLSSLLTQTEKDFEIICTVTDNSECIPLLKNYSILDKRIKVLQLKTNDLWLKEAMAKVSSEYVVLMRQGTVVTNILFEYFMRMTTSTSDIDFVYIPLIFKDELSSLLSSDSTVLPEDFSSRSPEGYFSRAAISETFLQKSDKQLYGKLIRTDLLRALIAEQTDLPHETVLFYQCLFNARTIAYSLMKIIFEWRYSDPYYPPSYKVDDETLKISVIVPVYNAEKYLAECLDSIVLQTYKNLEIICVDDGSTDNSPEILRQYAAKDKRFKIITQQNKGIGGARNTGLKAVTGDYISFVDADDSISLALYQKLVAIVFYEKRPIDLFQFNGLRFYDSFQNLAFRIHLISQINANNGFYNGHFRDYDIRVGDDLFCNKIYSADLLLSNNINFPEGLVFEDRLFTLEVHIKAKNVYVTENYMYFYRQHQTSVSHRLAKNVYDIFDVLDRMIVLLKKEGFYERTKYMFFQYLVIQCWTMLRFSQAKYQGHFLQMSRKYLRNFMSDLDEEMCRKGPYTEIYDCMMNYSIGELRKMVANQSLPRPHNPNFQLQKD